MGCIFSKKIDPHDKIIYTDPKIYLPYRGPIQQRAKFTPDYEASCKNFYTDLIVHGRVLLGDCNFKKNMYLELPCMIHPGCRTFDENNVEITSFFNTGCELEVAFIRNHLNHETYVPFLPVFEIIQTILNETEIPYIIHFERLVLNCYKWEENNAVFRVLFVNKGYKT